MASYNRPLEAVAMPRSFRGRTALVLAGLASAIQLAGLSLLTAGLANAHEGHDHGPASPPLPTTVKSRVTVETELYQLVGIATGERLTIFLDRYATNAPVIDAQISIMTASDTIAARAQTDGSYVATIPGIRSPGRYDLVFNVADKLGDDLLAGTLEIASTAVPTASRAIERPTNGVSLRYVPLLLALFAGIALGMSVKGRRMLVLAAVAALGLAVYVTAASAHDGHGPSPVPDGISLSGDTPRKLPDGSVFLPKPSQRLLSVLGQIAVDGAATRAVTLVGRIIADPNRSGLVQSINGGRVVAPEAGLPRLGQSVKAGDLLANVLPALPLADQSTLLEKQRELEGAISLARQKLARLQRIGAPTVARANIEDTELEIANLEQRLLSLKSARLAPELLQAPIDGVVSTARVVAGQVVGAQDVLFQIVDPTSLWVEALLFDSLDPGTITEATAIATDKSTMRLSYRGRGRALQSQAVQIQFAIDKPLANATIGQPVTVVARKAEAVRGMLLPRDAVVRGTAGETTVWQHLEPERFVARQIRMEPFDGEQVLITGGISPKDRIVVHGAETLSQVR